MDAPAAVAFGGIATSPQNTPQPRTAFSLAARIDQLRALRLTEEQRDSSATHKPKRARPNKAELTSEEAEILLIQIVDEKLNQYELIPALAELGTLWKQNKMPPLSAKALEAQLQLACRLYSLIYPGGADVTVDERLTDYVRTLLSAAGKGSIKTSTDSRALPLTVRGFMIHAALTVPGLRPHDRLRLCFHFSCPGMLLLPPVREAFIRACRTIKERHEEVLNGYMLGILRSKQGLEKVFEEIRASDGERAESLEAALLANRQPLLESLDDKLKIEEVVKAIETFAKLMNDAECEAMTPGEVEVLSELILLLHTEFIAYLMFHMVSFDFTDFAIHEAYEKPYAHLIQRAMRALTQLQVDSKIMTSLCDVMRTVLHHASFQDPLSFKMAPVQLGQQMKERVWQLVAQSASSAAQSAQPQFAQRMAKILHLLGIVAEPTPQFFDRMRTVLAPLIPLGSETQMVDSSNGHALFSAFVKDCAEHLPVNDRFNVLTLFTALAMFADHQIIPHNVHEQLMLCLEPEGVEISDETAENLGVVYMSGMLEACAKLLRHPQFFHVDEAPKASQLRYLFQLLNNNLHEQPAPHIARKTLLALAKIVPAAQACIIERGGETEGLTLIPQAQRALYRWWQAIDLHLLDAQEVLDLLEAMGVLIEVYSPSSDIEQMAILGLLSQAANHHLLTPKNLEQTGIVLNNLDRLLKQMKVGRLSIPVEKSLEQLKTQVAALLQRRQCDGRR